MANVAVAANDQDTSRVVVQTVKPTIGGGIGTMTLRDGTYTLGVIEAKPGDLRIRQSAQRRCAE